MNDQDKLAALDMLGSMVGYRDSRLLDDSVIDKICMQIMGALPLSYIVAFARAVEQAVLAKAVVKNSVTTDKEKIL
jgi:hypothetical protein